MINGILFRDMLISGANNIENQKQKINDLNIFPVPDGDTGTNMSMTISAAKREMENCNEKSLSKVSDIAANALLRGARGNSGVILSLLFRGFAKGVSGIESADIKELANAFSLGVSSAYKAVMKPTEGTILTVARVAAETACDIAEECESLPLFLETVLSAAEETLEKTPEMLPVLKQAGVVDSGGKGLCVILEGMMSAFRGSPISKKAGEEAKAEPETKNKADFSEFSDENIKFTYCTEYIVNKSEKADAEKLRKYLCSIGDCVVCVDGGDIIKVHVHTNDPGSAIKKGTENGSLMNMKIDNMRLENHEMSDLEKGNGTDKKEHKKAPIEKENGFVAVAAGEGLMNVFRDLGADVVVSGGQTMNPSTEDILLAIDETPASTVYILPNNKNIIMASEQAAKVSDKEIVVVPSKTVPQGITALLEYSETAGKEENLNAMKDACGRTKSASVTFAARDSSLGDKEIKEGQILGLCDGEIACVCDKIKDAVCKVAKKIGAGKDSSLTVFYGDEISDADADEMSEHLSKKLSCEVNMISGGMPVYYYILYAE